MPLSFSLAALLFLSASSARAQERGYADMVHRLGDKDPEIRNGAFAKLLASSASASADIRQGLEDPEPLVRGKCLQLVGKILDPRDLEAVERRARGDGDWFVRERALYVLGRFGGPEAETVLSEASGPQEPGNVRITALKLYAEAAGRRGMPRLRALLEDPEPLLRLAAAAELARLGDASVRPMALKAAESADWARRAAAVLVLGYAGDPADLALLRRMADNPKEDRRVRNNARHAFLHSKLGGLPPDRQFEFLKKSMNDPDEVVRIWAARELVARKSDPVVGFLKSVAAQEGRVGRAEAVRALQMILYP